MRICSLLPSSTEIAFALGLGDQVVTVTHECDYPPQARTKRIITNSALAKHDHTSSEIDQLVSTHAGQEHSLYHLNETVLWELNPDMILTQELCTVCAVSYREVQEAARVLEGECRIVSLEPTSLEDILDNIRLVGRLTGREPEAQNLVASLKARIDRVRTLAAEIRPRPRVFCLEWLDPFWVAGHWVPQMVWLAGGEDRLGRWKAPSFRTTWEEVARYRPEVVVMMPCGFDVERTLLELNRMDPPEVWNNLPAVRAGQIFVVNGSAYFNRPGPRIVDGLEILAEILHPEVFGSSLHEGAVHRLEGKWS